MAERDFPLQGPFGSKADSQSLKSNNTVKIADFVELGGKSGAATHKRK